MSANLFDGMERRVIVLDGGLVRAFLFTFEFMG